MNKKIKKETIYDIDKIVKETKKQSKDEMLLLINSIKNTLDTTVNLIKNDVINVIKKVDNLDLKFESISKELSNEIRTQFETFIRAESERKLIENNFINELDNLKNSHCTEDEYDIVKEIIEERKDKKNFKKKMINENKLQLSKTLLIIFTNVTSSVLVGIILYLLLKK
jgi:uncharacterized membrane protein